MCELALDSMFLRSESQHFLQITSEFDLKKLSAFDDKSVKIGIRETTAFDGR